MASREVHLAWRRGLRLLAEHQFRFRIWALAALLSVTAPATNAQRLHKGCGGRDAPCLEAGVVPDARMPRHFLLSRKSLSDAKRLVERDDPRLRRAIRTLVRLADESLLEGPFSVMDKERVPPSGDKHDFLGYSGRYYANGEKKEPLPEIRALSPKVDETPFIALGKAVERLALAYYFTSRERYAGHAAKLLRVWFLVPGTRMNPHGKYADMQRGDLSGAFPVALFSNVFIRLIDAAGLLEASDEWSEADRAALQAWCREFNSWMHESPEGRIKQRKANNHGTYFDMLSALLYMYSGDTEFARSAIRGYQQRFPRQFDESGRQPHEIDRINSLDYHRYHLRAVLNLASLSEHFPEFNLWQLRTPEGTTLRDAIAFLAPFALKERAWPHFPVKQYPVDEVNMTELFRHSAYGFYTDKVIVAAANDLTCKRPAMSVHLMRYRSEIGMPDCKAGRVVSK